MQEAALPGDTEWLEHRLLGNLLIGHARDHEVVEERPSTESDHQYI